MSAIVDALLAELDDQALKQLAKRLQPYLDHRPDDDPLLTPKDAAARLRVHPKTLVRAAADGRARGAQRVGNAWRFRPAELALQPPAALSPAPAPRPRVRSTKTDAASAIRGNRP